MPTPYEVRLVALDRAIQTLANDSSQHAQARCAAIVQAAESFAEFLNPATTKPSRQSSGGMVTLAGAERHIPPGEYTLTPATDDLRVPATDLSVAATQVLKHDGIEFQPLPPATDELAREDLDAPRHKPLPPTAVTPPSPPDPKTRVVSDLPPEAALGRSRSATYNDHWLTPIGDEAGQYPGDS